MDVYDPRVEWLQYGTHDSIRLTLTGFRKEDFRVQVDAAGRLKVWGVRPAGADGKRASLSKVLQLPAMAELREISARFEPAGNVLSLTVPKLLATEDVEVKRAGGGLLETARKNKQQVLVVATAIAAVSLGLLLSRELLSRN